MRRNDLLELIIARPVVKSLPLLSETIQQKWRYSHYLHGAVALEAGFMAQRPEAEIYGVAAGIELGWAAILVLDDIIDNDQVRYYAKSAWAQAGYPQASMEMACGLLEAMKLIENKNRDSFLRACAETIEAMNAICRLSLDSSLSEVEPFYRKLGALSSFAVAWPWPQYAELWKVADYETCAGQLVNDCNDCFGAKAVRRGYPDIRNHQVSLLTAILHDHYPHLETAELITGADASSSETIAATLLSVVQKNPAPLFEEFEIWHTSAIKLTENSQCSEARAWTKQRVERQFADWRGKLLRLLKLDKG